MATRKKHTTQYISVTQNQSTTSPMLINLPVVSTVYITTDPILPHPPKAPVRREYVEGEEPQIRSGSPNRFRTPPPLDQFVTPFRSLGSLGTGTGVFKIWGPDPRTPPPGWVGRVPDPKNKPDPAGEANKETAPHNYNFKNAPQPTQL